MYANCPADCQYDYLNAAPLTMQCRHPGCSPQEKCLFVTGTAVPKCPPVQLEMGTACSNMGTAVPFSVNKNRGFRQQKSFLFTEAPRPFTSHPKSARCSRRRCAPHFVDGVFEVVRRARAMSDQQGWCLHRDLVHHASMDSRGFDSLTESRRLVNKSPCCC